MQTRRKLAIDRSTTSYATTMPEKRRQSKTRKASGSLRLPSDRIGRISRHARTLRARRCDVSHGGHFIIKECSGRTTISHFGGRSSPAQPDVRADGLRLRSREERTGRKTVLRRAARRPGPGGSLQKSIARGLGKPAGRLHDATQGERATGIRRIRSKARRAWVERR